MYSFRYKHGDRPLEGYTIERAAGRGGFGEVYYAISDSGREVALKAVQGYEQIELRGIGQCMNLKSPHLVTIFDVRYNDEGRPFVIMEYVSGPSLRQLLDDSPSGLGEQKSAFFLREIGKGLSFLHECGVVHRDLKPGNVFYENGYVKIGDYGLSKALGPIAASGQTVTVGTLHYMAPEIGAGKYDRSIDIYALGACLYEMLTGMVPFVGASPSEILMKHLSAEPDVSALREPFATVVRRAMAKDPAQRYQTVQEMVEAVFGSEQVRQSMSVFRPEELSVVAGRVAAKMPAAIGAAGSSGAVPALGQPWQARPGTSSGPVAAFTPGQRISSAIPGPAVSASDVAPAAQVSHPELLDPMPAPQRALLSVAILVAIAGVAAAISGRPETGVLTFVAGGAGVIGLELARRFLLAAMQQESSNMQRIAMAAAASAMMTIATLPFIGTEFNSVPGGVWAALALALYLADCRKWIDPLREERVRLGPIIGAALIGWAASMILGSRSNAAMWIAGATAAGVAAWTPWIPFALRRQFSGTPLPAPFSLPIKVRTEWGKLTADGSAPTEPPPLPAATPAADVAAPLPASSAPTAPAAAPPKLLPPIVPKLWLFATAPLLATGIMFVVAGADQNVRTTCPEIGFGITLILAAILSSIQSFRRTTRGWMSYIGWPVTLLACSSSIICAGIGLANIDDRTAPVPLLFLVIFPAVILLMTAIAGVARLVTGASPAAGNPAAVPPDAVPPVVPRLWWGATAFLLAGGIVNLTYAASNGPPVSSDAPVAVGVVLILAAIVTGIQSFRRRMRGWMSYVGWPLLLLACVSSIVTSGIALSDQPRDSTPMPLLFFVIFPAVVLFMLFVAAIVSLARRPWSPPASARPASAAPPPQPKSASPVPPVTAAVWAAQMGEEIGRHAADFGQRIGDAFSQSRFKGNPTSSAREYRQQMREWRHAQRRQMREWRNMQRQSSYANNHPLPFFARVLHALCSLAIFIAVLLTLSLALYGPEAVVAVVRSNAVQTSQPGTATLGSLTITHTGKFPALAQFWAQNRGALADPKRGDEFVAVTHGAGAALVAILVAAGLTGIAMARRAGGAGYMLRGVVGPLLVFIGIAMLGASIRGPDVWAGVAKHLNPYDAQAAHDAFFGAWNKANAIAAGIVCLTGLMVGGWPAARTWMPQTPTSAPPAPPASFPGAPPIPAASGPQVAEAAAPGSR